MVSVWRGKSVVISLSTMASPFDIGELALMIAAAIDEPLSRAMLAMTCHRFAAWRAHQRLVKRNRRSLKHASNARIGEAIAGRRDRYARLIFAAGHVELGVALLAHHLPRWRHAVLPLAVKYCPFSTWAQLLALAPVRQLLREAIECGVTDLYKVFVKRTGGQRLLGLWYLYGIIHGTEFRCAGICEGLGYGHICLFGRLVVDAPIAWLHETHGDVYWFGGRWVQVPTTHGEWHMARRCTLCHVDTRRICPACLKGA